jgi:TetR/AcrR family transcriptional regulator, cholesterol catabolism regulator
MKEIKTSRRKQEILNSAATLFREKGYLATSVRDIAESVGIEPSSLYSHISSKEQLLIEICFNCADQFIMGLQVIRASQDNPAVLIQHVIDLHLRIAEENPTSITVFSDDWIHLPAEKREEFARLQKEYEEGLRSIVSEGIRQGLFADISAGIVVKTIISAIRWTHYQRKQLSPEARSLQKEEINRLLLNGLMQK